jgi:putative ABC transport system permease protein
MFWLQLTIKSMLNRKLTVGLTILAVAISTALWFGIEKVRYETKANFSNTLTGSQLIVGARTGATNLLLYSVFRIGQANNNLSYENYQKLVGLKQIDWHIPISLGDSHKSFRVIGTNENYLKHYKYADQQSLALNKGVWFDDVFDVVLGAQVASQLNYKVGDRIVLAHGMGDVSFSQHDNTPFTITGILARTGTPVDHSVHVSLQAIEAMHVDWQKGSKTNQSSLDDIRNMDLTPKEITAGFIGLKSKLSTFKVQRMINEFPHEAVMAIIPGVALQELWDTLSVLETALALVSLAVVITGLFGIVTVILAGLNERRREIAILRAQGAQPIKIASLLGFEALFIAVLGLVLGFLMQWGLLFIAKPYLLSEWGIAINVYRVPDQMLFMALLVLGITCVFAIIPAMVAYRQGLAASLSMRT